MNEANIQREVMIELSKLGAVVWRNNTGMLYNKRGTPVFYGLCKGSSDIIGIYKGRFLAVEVKTPKGKLSKSQDIFLNAVTNSGGIAFVARSKKDVKKFLNNFSY